MENQKAIVLYSGGLDSQLVAKILKEKKLNVFCVYFKLPFIKDNSSEIRKFCKKQKCKLKIFDCTKAKLFKEYLKILKKPKFGRGKGANPCIDCKIFMFKKTKKFADKKKIKIIASGEILGQRPMSQTAKSLKIIDKEIGFKVYRVLEEFGIYGRQRKKQMQLAKKYFFKHAQPSGGCLLCEKILAKKFKTLFENNLLNEKNFELSKIGRHFFIKKIWFVVGRNEKENKIIEKFKNSLKSSRGKPAVYYNLVKGKTSAEKLQQAYSKN